MTETKKGVWYKENEKYYLLDNFYKEVITIDLIDFVKFIRISKENCFEFTDKAIVERYLNRVE